MSKEKTLEEFKEESKGLGGSWLFGFLLMAGGILIIVLGILDLLGYFYVYNFLVTNDLGDVAVMLNIAGVMNFVVGVFAVLAGFGLIIDQEWAWGISMLILAYSTVMSITNVIHSNLSLSVNPSDSIASAILWVSIVVICVSVGGLVYLGLTKYKYA